MRNYGRDQLILWIFLFSSHLSMAYFQDATATNSNKRKDIDSISKSGPTTAPSQFFLDFVGTANLQQNISEANDQTQGSAGLGVIFERYFLERDKEGKTLKQYHKNFFESLDMEAYINVASSLDTLKAEVNITDLDTLVTNERTFGTYLINPVNSQQSVFINSNIYFNPSLDWKRSNWLAYFLTRIVSGANIRFNASNILWQLNDGATTNNIFAGAVSYRIGIFHEFLPNDKIRDKENRRKYSVRLGLAYSGRHIAGDLSSESNDELRSRFLGTIDKDFSGWEPFFSFRLNNIIAEFTAPSIGGSNRDDIDGLTDTQFIFSIRFVGGFSLKVNAQDNVK